MKLNKFDDPNYKIVDKGSHYISDAETLSIVISGKDPLEKAHTLLQKCDNNFNSIAKLSYFDMINNGLSHQQATRIIATNEYSNRKKLQDIPDKMKISCSKDVADIFQPLLSDLQHEEFWILFLNRSNKVISRMKLSQGGISGTVTDVRMVMKKAIESLASGIIVCHNHPSGNLNPSESDTKITQKIKEAGGILDIQLLDHIIIGENKYYSFTDSGIL
jgi:DNA repair protein RadC